MTSKRKHVKCWLPRFSVRTLAVVVTLTCCFCGLWQATATSGVDDVRVWLTYGKESPRSNDIIWQDSPPHPAPFSELDVNLALIKPIPVAPLVLRIAPDACWSGSRWRGMPKREHYCFWFFGYAAKLPYESEHQVGKWVEPN